MSGTSGSGIDGLDFLLMLRDEIESRELVVHFDKELAPHQRAVAEALGAKIVIRRRSVGT